MSLPGATMVRMAQLRFDAPFIGRAAELERFGRLLAETRSGTAAAVLVAGDAGVGKTRLVHEVCAAGAAAGHLVAVGHGVDIGAGGLPYLPFVEAVTALADGPAGDVVRQVVAERPVLQRLTGGDLAPTVADDGLARLPLFEAVNAVLVAVSREVAPLLLVLEDLHWAEASSRDLLRFVLARLGGQSLLVVATYRADDLHRRHPLRPLLAELVRLSRVERLDLAPFDDAELRRYLCSLSGHELPERVVAQISARSQGNAYYAEELLAAGDAPVVGLPEALVDVLLARLERLPGDAQQVVRVAAVAGQRVPDGLLRRAVGLGPGAVDDALREAVTHHLLVPESGDRYGFRHALLQEAVYGDLLPGERIRLHGRYARLLSERGDRAASSELAYHALACHDLPLALSASVAAADEAARRLAPAEALAHYEQALRLWESVPATARPAGAAGAAGAAGSAGAAGAAGFDEIDLLLRAAGTAASAGAHDRAVALAAEAARAADSGADAGRRAAAHGWLAHHLYAVEDPDGAVREASIVRELLAGQPSSEVGVWAAAVEARVAGYRRDAEAVERVVSQALPQAQALGLVTVEVDLMISRSFVEARSGGAKRVSRLLDEARRRAVVAGDAAAALRAVYNLAGIQVDDGDFPAAVVTLRQAIADAAAAGLAWSVYGLESRASLVNALELSGDWEGALAEAALARDSLPESAHPRVVVPTLPVHVARDPAAGLELVDSHLAVAQEYHGWAHQILGARAEALTWLGRYAEAVAAVDDGLALLAAGGEPNHLGGIYLCAVALAALADEVAQARARGDDGAVRRARDAAGRYLAHATAAAETGQPRYTELGPEGRAWVTRVEAEARRLRGSDGEAAGWRTAVAAFSYGQPYEVARCRWRLASALAVAGLRADAGRAASAARSVADDLGARPLRDAVDALARQARLDLGLGTVRAGVLTPREEEVMRLVAEGLTNRQIGRRLAISEKTASVHVSNILTKLGVSGRAEAVTVAHRRGLLPGPGS